MCACVTNTERQRHQSLARSLSGVLRSPGGWPKCAIACTSLRRNIPAPAKLPGTYANSTHTPAFRTCGALKTTRALSHAKRVCERARSLFAAVLCGFFGCNDAGFWFHSLTHTEERKPLTPSRLGAATCVVCGVGSKEVGWRGIVEWWFRAYIPHILNTLMRTPDDAHAARVIDVRVEHFAHVWGGGNVCGVRSSKGLIFADNPIIQPHSIPLCFSYMVYSMFCMWISVAIMLKRPRLALWTRCRCHIPIRFLRISTDFLHENGERLYLCIPENQRSSSSSHPEW